MKKIIDCILQNNTLSEEIKKKILLKAGLDIKKIKSDPSYRAKDEDVLKAIETLEKKGLRDKLESAKNLAKLNDLITVIDSLKDDKRFTTKLFGKNKLGKKDISSKAIREILMTKLDKTLSGKVDASTYGYTFQDSKQLMLLSYNSYMTPVIGRVAGLNQKQRFEFNDALAYLMDNRTTKLNKLDPQVKELAKIYKEKMDLWEAEKLRLMNDAGIIVNKRDDYFFQQTHSPAMLASTNKDTYIRYVADKIDPDKTVTPDNKSITEIAKENDQTISEASYEFLSTFYDNIIDEDMITNNPFSKQVGKSILKNKLNNERLLQFKSATDALEYKRKFGTSDDIVVDIHTQSERYAEDFAMASIMGSNPERNLDILLKHYRNDITPAHAKDVKNLFDYTIGKGRSYKKYKQKFLTNAIKNIIVTSKMGATSLTSLGGDSSAQAITRSQFYSDKYYIPVVAKSAYYIAKNFSTMILAGFNKLSKRDKETFMKGIYHTDNYLDNSVSERFLGGVEGGEVASIDGLTPDEIAQQERYRSGKIFDENSIMGKNANRIIRYSATGEGAKFLFDVSGQSALQRKTKSQSLTDLFSFIEGYRDLNFNSIQTENQKFFGMLREVGVNEKEWDEMRNAIKYEDGEYKLQEIMEGLSNESKKKFAKLNLFMQQFYVQEASNRIRSFGKRGLKSADDLGNLMDLTLQLKSFAMQATFNFAHRANLNLRLNSKNLDEITMMERMRQGKFVGDMLVHSVVTGYTIIQLKALFQGEGVIDPEEWFTGEKASENVLASFTTGGFSGFAGDVLTKDTDTYGSKISDLLLGPGYSIGDDVFSIGSNIVKGSLYEDEEIDYYGMVNQIEKSLPFNNLFYARAAKDQFIMKPLEKMINENKYREQMERANKYKDESRGTDRFLDISSGD